MVSFLLHSELIQLEMLQVRWACQCCIGMQHGKDGGCLASGQGWGLYLDLDKEIVEVDAGVAWW